MTSLILYATTDDDLRLPLVDVRHPAFLVSRWVEGGRVDRTAIQR